MSREIQISAAVLAEYIRTRRFTSIRRTKHNEKDENQIPFKYYRSAIAAITRFHKKRNNPAVLDNVVSELRAKYAASEDRPGRQLIIRNNIRAILDYKQWFAKRRFNVHKAPKLKFLRGAVLVGAKPDLMVIEDGETKIIRLDMKKKKPHRTEVNALLDITTQAAVMAGVKVRAENVLIFHVHDGSVDHGEQISTTRNQAINEACQEIEDKWPSL